MPALATLPILAALVVAVSATTTTTTTTSSEDHAVLPSYHYGAPIPVECMNRSSETGEHVEDSNHQLQWLPFPACEETHRPLELGYGVEAEVNCTVAVSHELFHLLEFYIHSDAPLSCRLPARPPAPVTVIGEAPPPQEYVPLVFAVAGTLQLSHMHVSTHMNVLLHSVPKRHRHHHDSGVIDSAISYSTSPLGHGHGHEDDGGTGGAQTKLTIGEPLPLRLSVRWFPTPQLPHSEGKVEWQGLGGHVYASTVFYSLVSFVAGALVAAMYTMGVVMPRRLRGRAMGGATPLGHGIGNGWGYSKRLD